MSKHVSNLFLVLIRSFGYLFVLLPMVASLAVAKADTESETILLRCLLIRMAENV